MSSFSSDCDFFFFHPTGSIRKENRESTLSCAFEGVLKRNQTFGEFFAHLNIIYVHTNKHTRTGILIDVHQNENLIKWLKSLVKYHHQRQQHSSVRTSTANLVENQKQAITHLHLSVFCKSIVQHTFRNTTYTKRKKRLLLIIYTTQKSTKFEPKQEVKDGIIILKVLRVSAV